MELRDLAHAPTDLIQPDPTTSQGLRLLDPASIVELLTARHGFAPEIFEGLVFFISGSKIIRTASLDSLPPPAIPSIDRLGIDFLRIDMAVPRLTTTSAMLLGHAATRNVVDLDRPECEQYLNRIHLPLSPDALTLCTSRGYVIIRFQGHGLGLGFLESNEPDESNYGHLRSHFPSAYAADLKHTSPFGNPS